MAYTFSTVEVWAGPISDRPGGAAKMLSALSRAGVSLEFVIARRDKPGKGVLFCAPITGPKKAGAARRAGLKPSDTLRSLRVTGPDAPGLGACLTEALAEAGINVRGLSGAALGRKAVFYLAFDNEKDARTARQVLKRACG